MSDEKHRLQNHALGQLNGYNQDTIKFVLVVISTLHEFHKQIKSLKSI